MKKTAIALGLCASILATSGVAGGPGAITDTGAPDFSAIERLLDDSGSDARRRLVEAIGAMDAYARRASLSASELAILGRAYLRAMGNGGSFRAGNLATQALRLDPTLGGAHLLLAELAAYSQCSTCAEEALADARAAGMDAASIAAVEGLTYWFQAIGDTKERAVGEKPPLERAIEAYERAVKAERDPVRLASYRSTLFELERTMGNHAKAIEHGEAVLAGEHSREDFIGKYATFLLYDRGDFERAAPLAARSASDGRLEDASETFAMVLFRIWADGYLADAKHPDNRIKLDTAKGANPDLGAVFAKALSSTATLPVATALLKAGLVKSNDPSMRDASGNTPLANAVAGARADFARSRDGDPYHQPLNDAQLAIVQMLLKQGANPNAFISGWNQTALGHAASRGDVRTVQLLLKRGANVHARMGEGSTVLAEAAESSRHAEADEIAALILARRVPVSATNKRGETALHAAARKGNIRLIQRLLKAGADPMAKDNSGWRPLELATSYGHTEAMKSLLAAGAQVTAVVNACGSTNALDIARGMQRKDLLEILRPHLKEDI
jgi:ankyrin repeat protein